MWGSWLFVIAVCVYGLPADGAAECRGDDCNPSYEPMPNIFAAMYGYNILKGNPVSAENNIDPGTYGLDYIFVPTKKNEQDRYLLEDGVIVHNAVNCDLQEQHEIISNARQYQEVMVKTSSVGNEMASNLEYDVSVSIPVKGAEVGVETTVPPLVSGAFQANNQVKKNDQFFSKRTGIIASSSATCTSYTLKISSQVPPPFHPGFINMITTLQDATESGDDGAKDRAFDKLVADFGTHYFKSAVMGSRITVTERLTREESSKLNTDELKECSKQNLNLLFGLIKDSSSQCKKVFKSESSQVYNEYRRRVTSTYGSKPAESLVEWSNQDMNAPLPIKMELDPILNLFREAFMGSIKDKKGREINFKSIVEWMGPKYLSYCEDNKDELGIKNCDVHNIKLKGCGINDECELDQECKNDQSHPNGYVCINPERKYQIRVFTSNINWAGTDANIQISLVDINNRQTRKITIDNEENNFEVGKVDQFEVKTTKRLDSLHKVIIYKDSAGEHPGWHPDKLKVRDVRRDREFEFPCGRWFYSGTYSCVEKTRKTEWNSKKKKFTKIVRNNKKW
eukprot:gene15786-17379_t